MTASENVEVSPLRVQQRNVLEEIAGHGDVAYTALRAAMRSLRLMESLIDLDVCAVKFVERELTEVLHRLDGMRFAVERLHDKAGRS